MPKVHHSALVVADLEASLAFYRDGLGLAVVMDHSFEGDWPTLFGARSRRLRSVMLGEGASPDSGIVELVHFEGEPGEVGSAGSARSEAGSARSAAGSARSARLAARSPSVGFFLLSLFVDVEATLGRLAALGVEPEGRITLPGPRGPVAMATVRDPDGVLVELISST